MKRISIVALVAVLVVMLVATVTQATTLTLQSTHSLTPTVTNTTDNVTLNPTGGYIEVGVTGNAKYSPTEPSSESTDSSNINLVTGTSVNASLGSGSWLQTTTANVIYNTNNTINMSQNFVVNAPNPSTSDGYFLQGGAAATSGRNYTAAYFDLTYNLTSGKNYSFSLLDAYTFLYQLANSTGLANYFDKTNGRLLLYASINYNGGGFDLHQWILGSTAADNRTGTPVNNFSLGTSSGTATLHGDITNASTGEMTFSGYLVAEDYGNSYAGTVPIPASVLLLGSGLVGLLALARRKKKPSA